MFLLVKWCAEPRTLNLSQGHPLRSSNSAAGDMAVLQTGVLLKQGISGFSMERVNIDAM